MVALPSGNSGGASRKLTQSVSSSSYTEESVDDRLMAVVKQELPDNIEDILICTRTDTGKIEQLSSTSLATYPAAIGFLRNCIKRCESRSEAPSRVAPSRDYSKSARAKGKRNIRSVPDADHAAVQRSKAPYRRAETRFSQRMITTETDEEPDAPCTVTCSFKISDGAMVRSYYKNKLALLQQQANKKLAKAWIRAICPKKQARFPYTNQQRMRETGCGAVIPGWWPMEDVCQYIEPDHIKSGQRMDLILHLLRLRPSPEQLKAWNGDEKAEPSPTHKSHGWTAFLKECTPPSIFDGLDSDKPWKLEQRKELLEAFYYVAEKEEALEKGECDAEDVITWVKAPEMASTRTASKRVRTSSVSSVDEPNLETSASSVDTNVSSKGDELAKHTFAMDLNNTAAGDTKPAVHDVEMGLEHPVTYGSQNATVNNKPPMVGTENAKQSDLAPVVKKARKSNAKRAPRSSQTAARKISTRASRIDFPACSYTTSPMTSSFDSMVSMESQHGLCEPYRLSEAQTFFPGKPAYAFAPFHHDPYVVETYQMRDVPQPQFDTVPNTPVISPTQLSYFPLNYTTSASDNIMPGQQYYTNNAFNPLQQSSMPPTTTTLTESNFAGNESFQSAAQFAPRQVSYGFRPTEYPNGLPNAYDDRHRRQQGDDQAPPYVQYEFRPESSVPAASLPASVVRGFTGCGSGVGGGAWV